MKLASCDPCSAERTCARHEGKFAPLSFSLVGRKVMGRRRLAAQERKR